MTEVFLDGYNLLFKMTAGDGSLEKRRKELIGKLIVYCGLKKGFRFIIVFDGSGDSLRKEEICENLSVVFTDSKADADRELIRMAYGNRGKPTVVVSSDRKIFSKTQNHGATALFSEEFISAYRARTEGQVYAHCFRNKKNESKRLEMLRLLS